MAEALGKAARHTCASLRSEFGPKRYTKLGPVVIHFAESIMSPLLVGLRKVRRAPALSRSALLCALFVALALGPALAQSDQSTVGVSTGDEFRRQLEDFKKTAPDLNAKIENSAKTIDELTDARKAREEIEQLRGVIAELLGRVSDNGELGKLGAKALTQFRAKLQSLAQDMRF